jgi:hypothetical protein
MCALARDYRLSASRSNDNIHSLGPAVLAAGTGLDSKHVGYLVSAGGAIGAVAMLVVGWYSDRSGDRLMIAFACTIILSSAFLILGFSSSPYIVAATYLLFATICFTTMLMASSWADVLHVAIEPYDRILKERLGNLGLADLVEHPKTLRKLKQLDLGMRLRCVSQSSVVQSKAEASVLWLWSHPFPTRVEKYTASHAFFGTVHGGVSISYQLFSGSAVVRINGDADARLDDRLQVSHVDRLSNVFQQDVSHSSNILVSLWVHH